MIIKAELETLVKSEKVIGVKCDRCGKIFTEDDLEEMEEFVHIRQYCGYGSVFGDGNELKVDICQHCMKEIIKRDFKDTQDLITEKS